jgi:hypothetical protein
MLKKSIYGQKDNIESLKIRAVYIPELKLSHKVHKYTSKMCASRTLHTS